MRYVHVHVLYMEFMFGMCGIQLEGALCSNVGESIPGRSSSIDASLLISFSIVVLVADEIIAGIDELLFNFMMCIIYF